MEGAHDESDTHDPKDKEIEEVEEIEAEKDGEAFIVLQETTPTVEKKWLRKSIFRSTGTSTWENLHSYDL